MPSATTTKSAMAGTKRKATPVKNVHVKKPKTDKDVVVKKASKSKSTTKTAPVKKVQEPSDSDEDDLDSDVDSDGGVPLDLEGTSSENDEEEDDSEENLPKVADGLHPERAKAVVVNSEFPLFSRLNSYLRMPRSIFQGSTCQTEAIGARTKSCKAISRLSGTNEENMGTFTPKITRPS
jgi:hypothetical protein